MLRRRAYILLTVLTATIAFAVAGCDLLGQKRAIRSVARAARPVNLSRPDSVLRMLEYIFSVHDEQAAEEYGDLLYDGYVYSPGTATDIELLPKDKAEEIEIYKWLFARYENISADFYVDEDQIWTEYGSRMSYPAETHANRVSAEHPDENWEVYTVFGDMVFTNTNPNGTLTGSTVRQYFLMKFRLDPTQKDSTWQLAAWTDLEAIL